MSTETRPAKVRKTTPYKLFYWPGIPGRGEFVRLAFEFAKTPYTEFNDPSSLLSIISDATKTGGAPPAFAPPALELPSGKIICQTGAILNHIAPRLGLAGSTDNLDDAEKDELRTCVNQVVLTALDLNNETHDTHHPLAVMNYYEEQKDAALERSKDFRANRIPKFFAYFENVLQGNPHKDAADGPFLVSDRTTTADLAVFHVVEGLLFAFPKRMAALRATDKYPTLWKLHQRLKEEDSIKAYLSSDRRQPFSDGIFRHYEELDGED